MIPQQSPELEMLTFFEKTPALVCIASKDGYFRKINESVYKKLGYTKEELFSRPISSFIFPDDREATARTRARMINGEALINFQNRYVTKDGNYIWLQWNSIYFPDKELVFAIAKDVTQNKLAEIAIEEKYKKFKGLATHFKTSIEEDRKYLAVELHEELAQLATVVKMDIEGIKINESGLSELSTKRLDHALGITTLLINTIRRISFSISPNMIEDIGLSETLKWHCKEFTLLNGIPCSFEGAIDESQLSTEIKLDFFRVCQEALTNVMYHAEANNVIVKLEDNPDKFSLSIIDDGKGFEINQQIHTPGINSMRERATFINGHISIQSEKGKGTMVNVSINKS